MLHRTKNATDISFTTSDQPKFLEKRFKLISKQPLFKGMTFTKDATQELRGRIDSFIREALTNWHELCDQDDYFKVINERISFEKVEALLKRALLFLDEAEIFTIHGFCQRAIAQHAFASGLPFNANLTTSSAEYVLEACQDWYRQLAKQNAESFALIWRVGSLTKANSCSGVTIAYLLVSVSIPSSSTWAFQRSTKS